MFAGKIGAEYDILKLTYPSALALNQMLGEYVAKWEPAYAKENRKLHVLEIGCGTGLTTIALLSGRSDLQLLSIDSSPKMLEQAKVNLTHWLVADQLQLVEIDALAGLKNQPDAGMDIVASGHAIHNFLQPYRNQVLAEIFRVLKPGGLFITCDRIAMHDSLQHLARTQQEARHLFEAFSGINRYDLLEDWIVHLLSDESPDHIMYLTPTLDQLNSLKFRSVNVEYRNDISTLLVAVK
jgi:tRNA (cmo5U34)-methyltransferase